MNYEKNFNAALLINTGTPNNLNSISIKNYLQEFLSDRRIIQLPRILWLPILYLFILPFRPKKKEKDYRKIWMQEGSPLLVYTNRLLKKLNNSKFKKKNIIIDIAMRYGEPNIKKQLKKLQEKKIKSIVILPLFPQFSFSTTESIRDKITSSLKELEWQPKIKFIKEYYREDIYLESIAEIIKESWKKKGKKQFLIFSYHGLPKKYIDRGDTYFDACVTTSNLISKKLNIKNDDFITSFHSKFGFGQWTKPYTENLLLELPKKGVKSISIISPSFVIDCLETLEEIEMQFREDFINSGGEEFEYIPCLNDRESHVLMIEKLLIK